MEEAEHLLRLKEEDEKYAPSYAAEAAALTAERAAAAAATEWARYTADSPLPDPWSQVSPKYFETFTLLVEPASAHTLAFAQSAILWP